MTARVVADLGVLFRLAHNLGQARLHGTAEEIATAEQAHVDYEQLFLSADDTICTNSKGERIGVASW